MIVMASLGDATELKRLRREAKFLLIRHPFVAWDSRDISQVTSMERWTADGVVDNSGVCLHEWIVAMQQESGWPFR